MSINSIFAKISTFAAIALLSVSTLSLPVSAQTTEVTGDWLCNLPGANCPVRDTLGRGADDIPTFIGNAIGIALPIVIVIGVLVLLYGAFQFIINKPEEGKKTIVNAIIGIVVSLLAVTLVAFIVGVIQGL